MSEENKAIARQAFEVIPSGDLDLLDSIYAPEAIGHGPDGELSGLDAIKANISVYLAAFSNMALTIDEQVAEGDSVVTRVTASGTFTGPLGDVQPTGKDLSIPITALMHIRDGRIVEEWELYDRLGMLQQLGVMPVEAPA